MGIMSDQEQGQELETAGEYIRGEDGKWLPGSKPAGMIRDPSQASAMAAKRWEAYREAAAAGVARATRRDTPVAGWGYIVEKQAELASDPTRGRGSTEAARFVGSALGLMGEGRRQDEQQQAQPAQELPPGVALRSILGDLRLLKDQMEGD